MHTHRPKPALTIEREWRNRQAEGGRPTLELRYDRKRKAMVA